MGWLVCHLLFYLNYGFGVEDWGGGWGDGRFRGGEFFLGFVSWGGVMMMVVEVLAV